MSKEKKFILFSFTDGESETFSRREIRAHDEHGNVISDLVEIRDKVIKPAMDKGKSFTVLLWKENFARTFNPLTLKYVDLAESLEAEA